VRKRHLKLTAKIPNYVADGIAWKRSIYDAVIEAKRRAGIRYLPNDKLDVEVCFHHQDHKLTKLDLDNRLKQVGETLQGFINDKGAGGLEPIIPNDNQIYRLVAEKRLPSKMMVRHPALLPLGVTLPMLAL
jgi:hypothetical protein